MRGNFNGYFLDPANNAVNVLISIKGEEIRDIYERLKDADLDIDIKQHRERRSKDANALLWKCISEISTAISADKWDVYLRLLRRYGRYTYVCIKPEALDSMMRQWRELEVIGEIEINGQKAVQCLCYFGSSTYNTQEFSELLDGVVTEMENVGLKAPPSEEMQRSLEQLNKRLLAAEKQKNISQM